MLCLLTGGDMLGVRRHEFLGHPVQELLGILGLIGCSRSCSWTTPQDRVVIHFRRLSSNCEVHSPRAQNTARSSCAIPAALSVRPGLAHNPVSTLG